MRLLMVTPRFLPELGGVETHVHEVGRRLAARGHEVTVACTDLTGTLPPREAVSGMTVRRVRAHPRHMDLRLAPSLPRIVAEGGWDVVHVQSYHTLVAPLGMLASRRARIPYVLTFHAGGHSGWLRNVGRPAQQWALRPLLVRAARLVALSRFEVPLYSRRLRLSPDLFVTVPNGADLPELAPGERPAVDPDLIVSVGRLERYKGHHRVVQAMPEVVARRPSARLWIAGAGPDEGRLRDQAARLGVADRVEIRAVPPSDRAAMARGLSSAAVVALLSDFETHPIAAIEAAALGRPVVVADTSGLRDLADRGLARAISLDGSPSGIAAAIIDEMSRPRQVAPVAVPTWDDCAAGLEDLYRDVCAGAA